MSSKDKPVSGAEAKVPLFRRSTIRVRLTLAFSFVAVLIIMVAAVGAWRLAELDRAVTVNLRVQRLIGQWMAESQSNAVRALVLARSEDPAVKTMLTPEMDAATVRISALQKQVEAVLSSPRTQAMFATISAKRQAYLALRQSALDKRQAGNNEEAVAIFDKSLVPAVHAYLASIEALADLYGGQVEGDSATAQGVAETGQYILIGVCLIGIALGFFFSWQITSAIVRPLRFAAKLARSVAGGDLTVHIRTGGRDEAAQLLQALADMTLNLRAVLGQVATGAHVVTDSSASIANGNQHLLQRTVQQAQTLEETASSMEQLTATVAQNADNAQSASRVAVTASDVAHKGGLVVGEVVSTMTGISQSSRKIADIISVIDGIAFQTNILALNAAVEAARAGEQGRGFAVVAAEVRSLAQRSAGAAKEIKALIDESVGKVDAGTRLVDAAGHTMQEIVTSVRQVTDLVAEIAAASQEQRSGIEQVNAAVTQMERVVQQNNSLVEDATTATESMKDQAGSLLQLVAQFKLGGDHAANLSALAGNGRLANPNVPAPIRVRPEPRLSASMRMVSPDAVDSKWRDL